MPTDYGKADALVSHLGKLLRTGHAADVIFIVGPENAELRAHSMILAARCAHLQQPVRDFLAETRADDAALAASGRPHRGIRALELHLPDVDARTLLVCLRFVYTGQVIITLRSALALYRLGDRLGVPGLLRNVCRHLRECATPADALELLREAIDDELPGAVATLTGIVAENCREALTSRAFVLATPAVVRHLLMQERLDASETEIWDALVRRAAACAGVDERARVSAMSGLERQKIVEHVWEFMGPGLLRTLNIPAQVFADEVEPLGALSTRDALLKYRFDATMGFADLPQAFPASTMEFINRIRRPRIVYESMHPHNAGVNVTHCVRLPAWATKVRVEFDERCKVGQYSELKFFQDAKCTTLLSIFTDDRHKSQKRMAGHKPQLSIDAGLTLNLPSARFWFSFYSPQNFEPAWGYKFTVQTF